jgi:hypothetical protein
MTLEADVVSVSGEGSEVHEYIWIYHDCNTVVQNWLQEET